MIRYSANYAYTNNNFVIQNIDSKHINEKYYSIICIMKNLLQRGIPTRYSKFLEEKLGVIDLINCKEKIYFIDRESPKWINTIKGDDKNNYFPALDFFKDKIPKYLEEYEFIRCLIVPEFKISEIVGKEEKQFVNQQVDFYLPQAKLVIEIDGGQHKDEAIKKNDAARDEYLTSNGIVTIRINTADLEEENECFKSKINLIKQRCCDYDKNLKPYLYYYFNQDNYKDNCKWNINIRATAVIRFQITILSLLEVGIINLDDKNWNIEISK
ncbi:endonuclease domain-containing protein [Clostridium magnum]|uniref:DUF559 domain-containing protein n=1 Tax=Clostridium magnum DSM 2767 TaxID=1121326 RepID=A0A162QJ33_9CLOT|nr:DUF559 domain-containing protein [Clostridium magnum]KZL88587.1 hypothetical protein CLMAG_60800 [Clostridium magnum DSM 2767]SHI83740.1 Protein of unknown function [Clostridium magnum DSM 2767]